MRRQTGLPTIDIMCAPCQRAGKRRRLARFDLGPDGPSVTAWTDAGTGQRVLPQWSTSPDGTEKVHLRCGGGHNRQIRRDRIEAALQAAPPGVSTIPL